MCPFEKWDRLPCIHISVLICKTIIKRFAAGRSECTWEKLWSWQCWMMRSVARVRHRAEPPQSRGSHSRDRTWGESTHGFCDHDQSLAIDKIKLSIQVQHKSPKASKVQSKLGTMNFDLGSLWNPMFHSGNPNIVWGCWDLGVGVWTSPWATQGMASSHPTRSGSITIMPGLVSSPDPAVLIMIVFLF